MPIPIVIATVGDLLDHGYRLTAHCPGSGRLEDVDLEDLAARVGLDRPYIAQALRLTCRECGRRGAALIVHPPTAGMTARPRGWT